MKLSHLAQRPAPRRGIVIAYVVIGAVLFAGIAALAVDVGHLYSVNAQLRRTADSAALAAIARLPDEDAAYLTAEGYGGLNEPGNGMVLTDSDFAVGNWDLEDRVFHEDVHPYNAVQLTVRRASSNSNPVHNYFAKQLGISTSDLSATAVAYRDRAVGGFRFLIDDEMIDTDIPAIMSLAASLGTTPEALLSDADGDHYLDVPPGTTLELPTGQVGDEALFEVDWDVFPFTLTSEPSMYDFLLYNTTGGPTYGIQDSQLDPLVGVEPVNSPGLYKKFVNPMATHVSPVFKSDVSNLTPWVNAKGERRGLVAFRIIGVGTDPPGSYLPNLIIKFVDPEEITTGDVGMGDNGIDDVGEYDGFRDGQIMLVQ